MSFGCMRRTYASNIRSRPDYADYHVSSMPFMTKQICASLHCHVGISRLSDLIEVFDEDKSVAVILALRKGHSADVPVDAVRSIAAFIEAFNGCTMQCRDDAAFNCRRAVSKGILYHPLIHSRLVRRMHIMAWPMYENTFMVILGSKDKEVGLIQKPSPFVAQPEVRIAQDDTTDEQDDPDDDVCYPYQYWFGFDDDVIGVSTWDYTGFI